jgi:phosphonate degradation associated HDIG domain protein
MSTAAKREEPAPVAPKDPMPTFYRPPARTQVPEMTRMTTIDEICTLFATRGGEAYFGEPVSQQGHALQAAWQAEQEGAPDALVVAALLHDIGHLAHGLPEDVAEQGVDARHEDLGEAWLASRFGPEVTEPVKLHVAAKRYLCAVDAAYAGQLSPASVRSLELQGGPFTVAEVREFEQHRYYREAVRLRRWDDLAKVPGLAVPGLEHYRARLEAVVRGA